jgi:hypothetical protein
VIRRSRRRSDRPYLQPYVLDVAVARTAAGVGALPFFKDVPNTLASTLSGPWPTVWAGMLLIGSVMVVLGLFWPGRLITALPLRYTGLAAAATAELAYAVALATHGSWSGYVVVCMMTGIGVADLRFGWLLLIEERRLWRDTLAAVEEARAMRHLLQAELPFGDQEGR